MAKKMSYAERSRRLRKLGVVTSTKSPQARGWVTRRWREYAGYTHRQNRIRVVKISPSQRRELKKTVPASHLTRRGLLVQAPTGAKVRVTKDGRLIVSKGRIREEHFKLDRIRLAKDPHAEIQRIYKQAKGKNKHVFITVRGYEGNTKYNLFQFLYYLENELFPQLDEREDEEGAKISHNFGLKIVSIKPSRKTKPPTKANHAKVKVSKLRRRNGA